MTSDLSFEVNRLIIISDNNVTELFIAMFPAAIVCVDNIQAYREWYKGILNIMPLYYIFAMYTAVTAILNT